MDQTGASAWRLRPAILAVVGAVAAIACAIVAGSVAWWSGGSAFSDLFEWQSASLILAIVVAAPLFQTARDAGRARFGYAKVHGHAWTDVVLWFAGWAFAGTVFAMAWLLASLFELIGSTRCPTCWRRGGSPSGWWAPRLVCSASAIPSSGRCSGLLRPCSACSRRCWARQGVGGICARREPAAGVRCQRDCTVPGAADRQLQRDSHPRPSPAAGERARGTDGVRLGGARVDFGAPGRRR